MKRIRWLLIPFLLILVSCAQPVATDAILTPTSTPTQMPSATLTGLPTMKINRSLTYTPLFPPTEEVFDPDVATYQALTTKVASIPGSCEPDFYAGMFTAREFPISPDGNWVIDSCFGGGSGLQVLRFDGEKSWSITAEEILATMPWQSSASEIYIFPAHWTRDSQFAYFEVYFCCSETGPGYSQDRGPLYRLDVQTGSWGPVVNQSEDDIDKYTYSFSPTDRRLVYIVSGGLIRPLPIHILDLKTGDLDLVELPKYNDGGSIVWSPDGLSFAFGAFRMDTWSYSVFTYEMNSKSLKNIFTSTPEQCNPIEWSENSVLTLSCLIFKPVERRYNQFYDLSNNLFLPSPTP